MADDWQPGDLALCVDDGPREFDDNPAIKRGCVYRVYQVGTDPFGLFGLCLDEVESNGYAGGYLADRFRKITPPEADEFDREVIKLMKPAKVPS